MSNYTYTVQTVSNTSTGCFASNVWVNPQQSGTFVQPQATQIQPLPITPQVAQAILEPEPEPDPEQTEHMVELLLKMRRKLG